MRLFIVAFFVAAFFSACAPKSDRPLAPSDLVFGKYPAEETVLRLKVPCSTEEPGGRRRFDLPVGDYRPITADSGGVYYHAPAPVISWIGIYFPFEARASSFPFFWNQVTNLEWGRGGSEKEWILPERCWKPYGTTMAIVHKGVEIPSR